MGVLLQVKQYCPALCTAMSCAVSCWGFFFLVRSDSTLPGGNWKVLNSSVEVIHGCAVLVARSWQNKPQHIWNSSTEIHGFIHLLFFFCSYIPCNYFYHELPMYTNSVQFIRFLGTFKFRIKAWNGLKFIEMKCDTHTPKKMTLLPFFNAENENLCAKPILVMSSFDDSRQVPF